MTEPKLNTTRDQREGYRREDGKRAEPSDYFKLALVDDVNALEDELARVREELEAEKDEVELKQACIQGMRENADRLREELAEIKSALALVCKAGKMDNEENAKLREELESARMVVDACQWFLQHHREKTDKFVGGESIEEAVDAYLERFGGRNDTL